MSHQQRVFNMLAKLSKNNEQGRKVKLALVDDLSDAANEAVVESNNIIAGVSDAYDRVGELISQIPSYEQDSDMLSNLAEKVEALMIETRAAADALGVDPSSMDAYAEAERALESLDEAQNTISSYMSEIAPVLKLGGF
jgi:DNA repair ATPase RecN